MSQQLRSCVVIGGAGAVGSMFVTLLTNSGAQVCVIDMRTPVATTVQFVHGDITSPTPDVHLAIKTADLILLAVPERVALAAVLPVATQMRPGALLAHTLSVQSPIATLIRSARLHVEVVGLNPMFAPTLSILGRPVAAIVLNDGPCSGELLSLISSWGGRVVQLGAEEHDRLTAATQVLTHAVVLAFGVALADLDIDITLLSTLAPPPHETLLALLARIVSGTPEVYWDVQSANPQAPVARLALLRGIEQLVTATEDETAFISVLQESRKILGTEYERYQNLCARIFSGPLSLSTSTSTLQENM